MFEPNNLSQLRNQFLLPGGQVYLCGHSLGAMPSKVVTKLNDILINDWGTKGVSSWNDADWIRMPRKVAGKIAKIIGASEHEVMVSDSLSLNLYKLLHGALRVQAGREIVIMDQDEFPADLYIASGVLKQYPNKKLLKVKREELLDQINEQVAVIVISHVNYLDSTLLDIKELASKAREYGVLLLVDLAHSAGALPINLQDAGIDMAVGCTYKYLNGGPGSLGFLFVADRHLEKMPNVIQGWMGHLEPFAFNKEYHPAANIDKFAGGTPAILSLSALDVSLDLILSASLANLREKSLSLTTILGNLILEYCGELELLTPRSEARGSHVAFYHPRGYEITQALQAAKVIADYRAQGVIRFGVAPLYNNLNDIEQAVAALEKILKTKQYTDPKYQQLRKVT